MCTHDEREKNDLAIVCRCFLSLYDIKENAKYIVLLFSLSILLKRTEERLCAIQKQAWPINTVSLQTYTHI
jgi:hypothetical protein